MSEIKIWTGERLETFVFSDTTVEHLHRYAITIDFVKDKIVLDIASGEGYGSNILAQYAEKVFGVDIDEISIEASKEKYKSKNLEFKVGSGDAIPLEDHSVDVVVSFETLEHHDKHHEMMREIKRVLRVNGILIMSTPDKKYYADEKNYKNPFHVKELYFSEFKELIRGHFSNAQFYFQNMFRGSLIVPEQKKTGFKSFEGDFQAINTGAGFVPMYIVAIASDEGLPIESNISGFVGNSIAAKEQEELQKKIRDEVVSWIKKSWSFRVGNAILSPLRIFKK